MIGCLRTRVRKQPIIALYFELETVRKFYNLEAKTDILLYFIMVQLSTDEKVKARREKEFI